MTSHDLQIGPKSQGRARLSLTLWTFQVSNSPVRSPFGEVFRSASICKERISKLVGLGSMCQGTIGRVACPAHHLYHLQPSRLGATGIIFTEEKKERTQIVRTRARYDLSLPNPQCGKMSEPVLAQLWNLVSWMLPLAGPARCDLDHAKVLALPGRVGRVALLGPWSW